MALRSAVALTLAAHCFTAEMEAAAPVKLERLALGFADGLDHKDLHAFVGSFVKHAPEDAKLVLMAYDNPPDVSQYGERVAVVSNDKKEKWDLANHRYTLYHEYVSSLKETPNVILNTDVSDVVFQGDPFLQPDEDTVHTGSEVQYIFANQWNLAWMEKEKACHSDMKGFVPSGYSISETEVMDAVVAYASANSLTKNDILSPTEKVAFGTMDAERKGVLKIEKKHEGEKGAKLASQLILCSGFTIGHGATMLKYWKAMEKELSSCYHDNSGQDQGAHQYLAYVKKPSDFKFEIMPATTSPHLATIGSITLDHELTECPTTGVQGFCYDENGFVHNADDHKPAVVHQYNRFDGLAERVLKRVADETVVDQDALATTNNYPPVPRSNFSQTELFDGIDKDSLDRFQRGLKGEKDIGKVKGKGKDKAPNAKRAAHSMLAA